MANIPSEDKVKQLQEQAAKELADKVADQHAQGKSFHIDAGGHGPGVIPEETWQNLPGKVQE